MKNSVVKTVILVFIPFLTFGQKTLSPKKLVNDFNAMIDAIEAHPDPYRYLSEEDFGKMADSIRGQLTEEMDVISFYKICAPIIHAIKDGHTSLRLPLNYMEKHMKKYGAFPLGIHLTDDERMYVVKNYGEDETIQLGTEIISINDVLVSDFIKGIDAFTFYERKPFRNSSIEKRINTLLYLYFGPFEELKINCFSHEEEVHVVQNIDYKVYKKEKKDQGVNVTKLIKMGKPYEYKKLTKEVGYLKIHSFLIPDEKKFQRFLRKKFGQIKKDSVTSLVIDVRGNLGGFPRASSEIFHFLTDIPFKTMALSQMKISNTFRNRFRDENPHINLSAVNFRRSKYSIDLNSLFKGEVGTYTTEMNNNNELPITMESEFTGDLYLLTDRTSFSAASSFAATFRCYGMGIIVGEPTGGTRVFFGNSIPVKLKHSRHTLRIGTVKNYTTCFPEEENEPIIPDVPSIASVLDKVNNSDQTLFFTLNLIKKIKRQRANSK